MASSPGRFLACSLASSLAWSLGRSPSCSIAPDRNKRPLFTIIPMAGPRVLCFGELLFDQWIEPSAVQAAGAEPLPGGAPANVAMGLTKLGTAAGLLGCVGTDDRGQALAHYLEAQGVNLQGLQRHSSAPTRLVEIAAGAGEEPVFVGFGGGDPASFADAQIDAAALPQALFADADYLVLGTLPLAYDASAAALERALELADEFYVKLVLDVNWRSPFWPNPDLARPKIEALLNRVDFVKLTQAEANWLFGTTAPEVILQRLDHLEGVVVTAGLEGADYAFCSGVAGHSSGFRAAVQDTLGAGDAFVAGLVHWLTHHSLIKLQDEGFVAEAMRYANAAGCLATQRAGAMAALASDAEIQAFLVGRTA